ncbi:hypothetical protein M422DRAFT_268690 [Sphaerobolus stellatus SS14]|uniref:Uncharacterized protein n=1 Tax=Sphaerobolus stellatus (strain SS14) TaxID=990650 RepID=A0A0C9U6B5_SPHS4|nr:hypothetical protein M422DRAFT_268690 [Sphaerobolus stellatus SS14]
MSNSESDNALLQMVKYMLDQNINTTMEKSPLAKAGVKVTPPNKYSREQSFEALETFVKGLLRWLDMHSMLGPDVYKYQVSFLGMRLEGKALEWFSKTVKPRKYQGTPMDLEQVVTGLYGQYIPSLARHKVSNKFDFIKQDTLSVQEFTTELELPRNNGPDRTKTHAYPPKSGEINKGPSINIRPSGVKRNSSNAPGHIKPNCPEPLRAHCVGGVHIEYSTTEQVDDIDHDINDLIDDERPTEDEYSGAANPANSTGLMMTSLAELTRFDIAMIWQEGGTLYDHIVKMKTTRPAWSKNDPLTITGYFLVGGTKACCLFDSGCEGIIMSSKFVQATGIRMHKLPESIGIQQAFQGSRVKLYYTVTMDITVGQRTYTEMFNISNVDYYDIMLGTPFLRRFKANIDFNGLGSIVINGEMIDNDLSYHPPAKQKWIIADPLASITGYYPNPWPAFRGTSEWILEQDVHDAEMRRLYTEAKVLQPHERSPDHTVVMFHIDKYARSLPGLPRSLVARHDNPDWMTEVIQSFNSNPSGVPRNLR